MTDQSRQQRPLRIAILTDTFSKNMGYAESALPKAMAALGHELHVVSMDLKPYYYLPDFNSVYGGFTAAEPTVDQEMVDGFTVHYLPHRKLIGYLRMRGLRTKLEQIGPDIVQTFSAVSWLPMDAMLYRPRLGYKLFTGNHTTASVFPLSREPRRPWNPRYVKNLLFRALPGRLISWATEKCYGATVDCAELAVEYFGVQRSKISISPLGVDTGRFKPPAGDAVQRRDQIRRRFGFQPDEIVCVYTGRFTPEKNPLLLAQAVAALRAAGEPYRGLFVGGGTQAEAIAACEGCVVQPFVPVQELAPYFWASEIGVWPTQESMSMLDAAACGLPIVVNDTMRATERIEGNGIAYRLNDRDDLVRALRELRSDQRRKQLGDCGALRMARDFSWTAIAQQRLADYRAALCR